jgi:catechol 2,3-dioxygenase-like lactoylglutathione lyase family enzyme
MSFVDLVTLIVADYDEAISFFVEVLDFDLIEDEAALTNDGRPKRWVVVRPKGGGAGLLLAKADGEFQNDAIGSQFAGRVGLFLRVDDFNQTYRRLKGSGVEFVSEPRSEPYGMVAVFLDLAGNKWDLLSNS